MKKIFFKFLKRYFFKDKELNFIGRNLTFKKEKILKRLFGVYFVLFSIFFIAIGFASDYSNTIFSLIVFGIGCIPLFVGNWYIVGFYTRSNEIPKYLGVLSILLLLFLVPGFFIVCYPQIIPQLFAYYFFYIFFLVLIFYLLPKLYYFALNFKASIVSVFLIFLLFTKGLFIKFDKHNIEKIINKLYINKGVTSKKVDKYLLTLKNKFKIYSGILAGYTFINLFSGFSLYGVYRDYIHPFFSNITIYIEALANGSKGLVMLYDLSFIVVLWLAILGFGHFIATTFYLYIEIYFFELLLKRLNRKR